MLWSVVHINIKHDIMIERLCMLMNFSCLLADFENALSDIFQRIFQEYYQCGSLADYGRMQQILFAISWGNREITSSAAVVIDKASDLIKLVDHQSDRTLFRPRNIRICSWKLFFILLNLRAT